ncbi:unnamed protein product [Rotaria socialis]|uniref:Lysosome membrane protein 2 n=1 Tax=Rotaria socialis TaxID=392032 RepID=A0A818UVK5_9BILA|nr:unnamed protein product [Rotaria socialis]CAF4774250.1 unnamed protein product [Rotaria socialis]
MIKNRVRCASIVLGVLGVGCLVAGVLLIVIGDSVVDKMIEKECQLREGTLLYKNWLSPPITIYMSVYVFDLTNPVEFLNGAKPLLIEHGPFVYKEQRTKTNLRTYENETLSYQEPRQYIFDRSQSAYDETFKFTTINVIYMTLVNLLQMDRIPNVYRSIVADVVATIEKPLMTRSVREYLWGYQDPLLHIFKKILPEIVLDDQIALFGSAVYLFAYDTYLIKNGVGRSSQVGIIERFNYSTSLPIWSDPYANMINGTDSTVWHPNARKDERFYAYIRDICRSVYLTFNETRRNFAGIDLYHYTLPETIFSNSTDNQGFCMNATTANKTHALHCLPSGLFTQTPCQHFSSVTIDFPLPIIASNPHFLDADPIVSNAVDGMQPDSELHRSFGDVEPRTGIIMNGSRRLQFNMNVVNDSSISLLSNIRPVFYPMFWGSEHAAIDEPTAKVFRNFVVIPLLILTILKYLLVGIGICCLIALCIILVVHRRRKQTTTVDFSSSVANETSPLLN